MNQYLANVSDGDPCPAFILNNPYAKRMWDQGVNFPIPPPHIMQTNEDMRRQYGEQYYNYPKNYMHHGLQIPRQNQYDEQERRRLEQERQRLEEDRRRLEQEREIFERERQRHNQNRQYIRQEQHDFFENPRNDFNRIFMEQQDVFINNPERLVEFIINANDGGIPQRNNIQQQVNNGERGECYFMKRYKFEEDQERQCCFCLADFVNNEQVAKTICLHVIHKPCLDEWMIEYKKCPICSTNFEEV